MRPARTRRFQRLQHQHAAAFAQNQPAPVFGKWPAGIGRNHAHRFPRLQKPRLKIASLPPVIARSAKPLRTIQNACPIA